MLYWITYAHLARADADIYDDKVNRGEVIVEEKGNPIFYGRDYRGKGKCNSDNRNQDGRLSQKSSMSDYFDRE